MDKKTIKNTKVLFVYPQGIGDVLLLTPILMGLKKSYPDIRVGLYLKSIVEYSVLKGSRYIDDVFLHDKNKSSIYGNIKFVFNLRKVYSPNVCIIVSEHSRIINKLFAWLIGAKFNEFVRSTNPLSGYHNIPVNGSHKTERIISAVKQIFPRFTPGSSFIQLNNEDDNIAENKWRDLNFIGKNVLGVHPGSDSMIKAKRYPIDKFVEIIKLYIFKRPDSKCIVFLGPSDLPLEKDILSINDTRVSIIKNVSINVVAGLIKRCNILLSCDSGLTHIAAAVGTNNVVIYGPTNPNIIKPYNGDVSIIRHTPILDCMPCYHNKLFQLCMHRNCLEQIHPQTIVDTIINYGTSNHN